jgi:serine beta-lactamase-like protein LACTB, mitochondrial
LWHDKAPQISPDVVAMKTIQFFSKNYCPQRFVVGVLVLFYSAAAISPHVSAQATAPPAAAPNHFPAGDIERVHTIAKEWLARGIPGFSVTVAVDGKVVYSEGFGYADLEQRVPAWPTTKFRIGSVSKPLTAAALLRLVEQGKLDLDAPIQKYVPSFPDKGAVITPRMLAGHLAGIRHYKGDEFLIARHYDNVAAGLAIFQDDPLVSPPGTKFNYSSYGFNLLSAAIEKACAEDFLSCMRDLVFTPLGLRATIADQPSELIEQRARFYTHWKDKALQNAPYVDNSYKWAGGGFLSSSEDLVRFGNALLAPGYLKKESLALLFTSQKTRSGEETGYGMGWSIQKSKSGKRIFEHSGGSAGGSSQLTLYPDEHLVIAMVCNYEADGNSWKFEEVQSIAEAFDIK